MYVVNAILGNLLVEAVDAQLRAMVVAGTMASIVLTGGAIKANRTAMYALAPGLPKYHDKTMWQC